MISKRTKDALSAAKGRGARLGNPRWRESIAAAREAKKLAPIPDAVMQTLNELRSSGLTLRSIAGRLNALGIRTPQGSNWYASTVRGALNRAALRTVTFPFNLYVSSDCFPWLMPSDASTKPCGFRMLL